MSDKTVRATTPQNTMLSRIMVGPYDNYGGRGRKQPSERDGTEPFVAFGEVAEKREKPRGEDEQGVGHAAIFAK